MKTQLRNITRTFRIVFLLITGTYYINSQAQIIYTDIVPDYTSDDLYDFYNLDLNNDQQVDYVIGSYSDYFGFTYLQIFSPNSFNSIISVTPWSANPLPLNNGVVIDQTPTTTNGETYETWGIFTVGDCPIYEPNCFYDWENLKDKYLGLRFFYNGQNHYGWARMDVTSPTQWVIKDYAYNATPNQHIFAGQTTLGLEESFFAEVKIIVSNRVVSIHNLPNHSKFNLYTLNGQKLLYGDLEKINHTINVENLSSGLYILELIAHNSASTMKRKIIIH